MRLLWLLPVALVLCSTLVLGYEDSNLEDDDFAEFEQFDADDDTPESTDFKEEVPVQKPKPDAFASVADVEEDMIVEDEDNEFEHFQDPEEFEGFQDAVPRSSEQPKITISKVPITARPRWDAYWLEGILVLLLITYALSYGVGRSKNTAIAVNFLKLHKPLLDENFTLVGEKGNDVVAYEEGERGWRREAEHMFSLWSSGRLGCDGMLLTLRLIKRQDLLHVALNLFRPSCDTLLVRVELAKDEADPFVLCVAQKKLAAKLSKEMHDLSVFCPERRPGDKHNLPASLSVLSESAEATSAMLDSRVTQALTLYHKHIQYIHISDRYCGVKQMEDQGATKPPEVERVLLAALSLEGGGEAARPLLQLLLHLVDKAKKIRLSKEALAKCEKRRQKVVEAWQRGAHAARQELAAARREEKRKQEKEKILAEDDPEKQRRWELKEQKRQQKKKAPRMKQLKVKAL